MDTYRKRKRFIDWAVWLVLTLSVISGLLSINVSASISWSLLGKPFTTVNAPPVLLQAGVAGASTIYANSTSAAVNISAPVGIQYGYAFNASNTKVTTTNGPSNPANDPQALLNIVLSQNSTVFIVYNAGNAQGSTENLNGKGCAINVDGVDVAFSWQSPNGANAADSVTVVYAANLTSGSHVIKGRFFANTSGTTVTIDTRQIAAFWFPNIVSSYVRSTTASQTNSSTPVDDPQAIATFTLTSNSVVFIVYNAGNMAGSTENSGGKGVTINVDGNDIATNQSQSPWDANYANSVTIAYVCTLGPGSHTVKGRFFSVQAGNVTTIDERQLVVLCFNASLVTYGFVQSSTAVSTSSGSPVNDTQAILSANLGNESTILAMYVGGNSQGATEDANGDGVGLNIDSTTEISNSSSWQSPDYINWANSATSIWVESLTQGSHTIWGSFWADTAGNTVTISNRELLILAFPCADVLKIVNQATNAWSINLNVYNSSNTGRLSSMTISFHDGSMNDQTLISNGSITQSQGAPYTLPGGSGFTVFISVGNLVTNATGTSYLYVYLKILTPNTTTYALYVITFIVA
jgi:hypothetical protein